jgi:hypothetical protein
MIHNDAELQGTRERIAFFQDVLANLRRHASPQDFEVMSGSYRAELERMNKEIMEYLTRHASEPTPVDA